MAASIPRALTIAGSDSGGGAGVQADLKTFAALGVYGMSAITSVTAQNTVQVAGVHDLPPTFVALQIGLVAEDIGVDAAKTGMLSNAEIIEAVAQAVSRAHITKLVVDPVMVAKSGDALLQASACDALRRLLLPLSLMVTPNIPEAVVLSGRAIESAEDIEAAAKAIHALGPRYVLMKGGHLDTVHATDYLFDGETMHAFEGPRFDTPNTHGTGCTFSAAITAELALGASPIEAVRRAKEYLTEAILHSLPLGHGHGPLHHGWRQGKLGETNHV